MLTTLLPWSVTTVRRLPLRTHGEAAGEVVDTSTWPGTITTANSTVTLPSSSCLDLLLPMDPLLLDDQCLLLMTAPVMMRLEPKCASSTGTTCASTSLTTVRRLAG